MPYLMSLSGSEIDHGLTLFEAKFPFESSIEQELTEQIRNQDHITKEQLRLIVEWKHSGQRGGRVAVNQERFAGVSGEVIRKISNAAFTANDPALQLKILNSIPGVGYATASTILTFHDPESYVIGDRVVIETVLGRRESVRPSNYAELLEQLRQVKPTGYTLRDVEQFLYMQGVE